MDFDQLLVVQVEVVRSPSSPLGFFGTGIRLVQVLVFNRLMSIQLLTPIRDPNFRPPLRLPFLKFNFNFKFRIF